MRISPNSPSSLPRKRQLPHAHSLASWSEGGVLHPFTGPCAYTQGNKCGSLRIKDGSTAGAGGPATDTSETTSHELNPPLPHRTYCALILRKLTLCGSTSAVTTEARLRPHTCHQHYQVCCAHFLGASRHLDCGPPGEASLVDHIWKRPLSKLALAKACSDMYQISSGTEVDTQYHMPNAWSLSSEI